MSSYGLLKGGVAIYGQLWAIGGRRIITNVKMVMNYMLTYVNIHLPSSTMGRLFGVVLSFLESHVKAEQNGMYRLWGGMYRLWGACTGCGGMYRLWGACTGCGGHVQVVGGSLSIPCIHFTHQCGFLRRKRLIPPDEDQAQSPNGAPHPEAKPRMPKVEEVSSPSVDSPTADESQI